jgi:hypothetical protein
MTTGFQTQVNVDPAPAVAGDFASANPRSTVLAGPGGLVAGLSGVIVGRFAWIGPDFRTTDSFGTTPNAPDGFVHRDQQALITVYLQGASNAVPTGFPVTLHNSGDFWAYNNGPSALKKGDTVYAGFADGGIYSAAPTGASATGAIGSTNTASLGATFTATAGSPDDTQLVVTAVTGLISVGDKLSGTGITAGTTILSQLSGIPGGAGTYQLSAANTTAAATVTSFGTVVKVTATTGLISVGDTISGGAGFPVGAVIVSQVSGTPGGAGVYTISAPGTAYTASAAGVTTFGTVLVVSAVGSGQLFVGMPITGANMPTTAIASQVSGTPEGAGTYTLFLPATQYVASEAFTTAGGIDSGWKAAPTNQGDGAVGSLVKISTYKQ